MSPPKDDDGALFNVPRESSTGSSAPKGRGPRARRPAPELPVARVVVDTPLPHLDQPFDYLVPEAMDAQAVPGCRVRVGFNGRTLDGFLLERIAESSFEGQLAYLRQVVSSEPVLTPEIAGLARLVADRYAGTLSDVLRLAIPPRHGRVEREPAAAAAKPPAPPPAGPWEDYPAGPAFLSALREGGAPRAVWSALPGPQWSDAVAVAVAEAVAAGRGAVVVVPDGRDVAAVDAALDERMGAGRHVALTAELGPAERYRRWLALLRGQRRAVVGTRAAMFAPVAELGLVVLWDDGDDVHADPHAPYPHARTVLSLRAHRAGAAALIGGFTCTTDAARLVESGWARPLAAARDTVRARAPRVLATGDDTEMARDEAARSARLPSLALRVAREAAQEGPVLVQVPRRGYLDALACARCRAPARCGSCNGPLALQSAHAMPYCRWCGHIAGDWRCGACEHGRLRATAVGARRTAEELGRAFPALPVRTSGREEVVTRVPARAALVVATPGAEPVADGGYAAALLLDGGTLLGRADLRAAEEALRRWCNAAALVRPAGDGGRVVVLAEAGLAVTQALIRWDPAGFAERELAERRELGFPPAVTMASVTGEPENVREFVDSLELPEEAELLGPVPVAAEGSGTAERALLRVPMGSARALAASLKAAAVARSARKDERLVQVHLDPMRTI
ncbi:primosomal protein N' [Salinactinospora qingdaonensis]